RRRSSRGTGPSPPVAPAPEAATVAPSRPPRRWSAIAPGAGPGTDRGSTPLTARALQARSTTPAYRDRRDRRRSIRRHRPVPHRGPRGAARRPGRVDPPGALARTGDRRGIRRAVGPGDAAAVRPAARAALVLGLRHASRAGPPHRVAAVPHGRRRPGRALPARPLPRTRRAAAGDHP